MVDFSECSRFLEFEFPYVKEIITSPRWKDLRKLAKDNPASFPTLARALIIHRERMTDFRWNAFVKDFPKMLDKGGVGAIKGAVTIFDDWVDEKHWSLLREGLPRITKVVGDIQAGTQSILALYHDYAFTDTGKYTTLKYGPIVNEETWFDFVKFVELCPKGLENILNHLLPIIAEPYNKKELKWPEINKFILALLAHNRLTINMQFIPNDISRRFIIQLDAKGILAYLNDLKKDSRYNSVQGLSTLGFLCSHVTNALGGGVAVLPGEARRDDHYANIITCLRAQGTNKFQLSFSTLKPGIISSIAVTRQGGIDGAVGVVLDSGYIYEAYYSDANTSSGTKTGGISYRTGEVEKRILGAIAVNFGGGKYNELITRNWTIGGLFYTKGVQREVIAKLQALCAEYSYKEYPNPVWINRKSNNLPEIQADLERDYPYTKGKLIEGGKKIIKV